MGIGFTVIAMMAATVPPQTALSPTAAPAPTIGMPIELMVMREVDGDHAEAGAEVRLTVNRAVAVEGGTIPYGTPAFGEVVRTVHSGMAMKRGTIAIKLTRLMLGGRPVPITGGFGTRGGGGESDNFVKVLFVPMYVLFSPGNGGKVKAGQLIQGNLPTGFTLTPAAPNP